MNPRIGITFARNEKPSDQEYMEAVSEAGGIPVVLRPDAKSKNFEDLHGLLLAGGEDMDPDFYGEQKEAFCEEPDRARDEFEIDILKKFLPAKKPVLAICRGIQVLNVAFGGNLYQDMEHQYKITIDPSHRSQNHLSREEKRAFRHPVKIKSKSILHDLFGDQVEVNSRHHQAPKDVPPNLEITAVSSDGTIEGLESKDHPWVVGVQWHPEAPEVRKWFAPLFEKFVFKCGERR